MTSDGRWADEMIDETVVTAEEIAAAVERLGREITRDYQGKKLLVIGILRGASLFMADLIRRIELPLVIDFISVSSYGAETKSSGVVRILKDLAVPLSGYDALFVEDIVDTGLTWAYLRQIFEARQPASLRICALLDKPAARKIPVTVDYCGFSIGDKFVVGYGLDLKEQYRNLPFIVTPKLARRAAE